MKLLFATTNRGKVRELERLLKSALPNVELVVLGDDAPPVIEDAETFEGNARKKAREMAAFTKLPTLADDSGLEVDALGGAPGVHSARYAGDGGDAANVDKLLGALRDVPDAKRTARFRCALALEWPGNPARARVAFGVCEGRIGHERRGAGGFGYDPIFIVDGERTMAELDPLEKNLRSHRGRAFAEMLPWLMKIAQDP